MRSNALTRTVVSLTAVVGLAAGTVAAAGTSFAAPQPAAKSAVSAQDVSVLAVNNLGLSNRQAKNVQCWLKNGGWGYTGDIDGLLGTNSWKAYQGFLTDYGYPSDEIDGAVGPNTIKALQRQLKRDGWGYNGDIDGIAGTKTKEAFKRYANAVRDFC
jgi:lysozyme family protein